MKHIFDVEIAQKYGLNAAILLENIGYWIKQNEANETNFYDGTYWTFNSRRAYRELFPYMSKRQINTAFEILIDDGLIITGNYNTLAYDRTMWYALTQKGKCILHFETMDDINMLNGNAQNVKPIPNINTYKNKNINSNNSKKEREKASSYDELIAEVADEELRDLFGEYIKMRKMIKSPMTNRALSMLIKKVYELEPYSVDRQKQLLETAIMNNWKSVYPIKDEQANTKYASQNKQTATGDFMNQLKAMYDTD